VSPASGRRLVVEADGGSRGNPGPAGYGAVVLDGGPGGPVLAEVAKSIGRATNNVAEYGGLLAGLRAAHAIDPDATVLVQMSGRWKVKHADMQRLWQEAQAVWPRGSVRFEWIPRAQNSHADRLANEAMDAAAAGRTWTAKHVPGAVKEGVDEMFEELGDLLLELGDAETVDVPEEEQPVTSSSSTTADVGTASTALPATAAAPTGDRPRRKSYKLLTGPDTPAFCQKVSDHLDEGYALHGPPVITVVGGELHCAQAVLLPEDQR
jgi:ribonuclease HI